MKAIGFKNFRNFEELPLLEFGKEGVTFLVGQNNAGKSTLTKACRLMAENMSSGIYHDYEFIDFFNQSEPCAIIDFGKVCHSFKRALRIDADNQKMEFTVKTGYFTITYTINGMIDDGQNTRGRVSQIKIYDKIDDCTWISDFENHFAKLEYNGKLLSHIIEQNLIDEHLQYYNTKCVPLLRLDEAEVEKLFKSCRDKNPKITEADFAIFLWENIYKQFDLQGLRDDQTPHEIKITSFTDRHMRPFESEKLDLIWIDDSGKEVHDLQYENAYMEKCRMKKMFDINLEIKHNMLVFDVKSLFSTIRQDYQKAIQNKVIYLPANETPQCSDFYIGGENLNYFETVVRDFYYAKQRRERERWVMSRMKDLGIGKQLVLRSQLGEVVSIFVTKEDGTELPLSDLGRGTIHIIMLLLSVAVQMKESSFTYEQVVEEEALDAEIANQDNRVVQYRSRHDSLLPNCTIIVEEPEQNLHPALQSKLADLFLNISKTFRCNVIVETHSEYMIRRSQVLVANEGYKDQNELNQKCPFKVYYFGENTYTDMQYQTTGSFINQFGEGFFDESAKLDMEIIRNELQQPIRRIK